jgi:hypothetical protein
MPLPFKSILFSASSHLTFPILLPFSTVTAHPDVFCAGGACCSNGDCQSCLPGQFAADFDQQCSNCSTGFYSIARAESCYGASECPRGTFIEPPNKCSECPAGLASPVGSISATNCSADADLALYPTSLPAFTASGTNSAQLNTVDVSIHACPGYTTVLSTCASDGGANAGYVNYLRLMNGAGSQVAAGFNSCEFGARITYVFTEACQTYVVKQGCYLDGSCSGTVSLTIESKKLPHCFIHQRYNDRAFNRLTSFLSSSLRLKTLLLLFSTLYLLSPVSYLLLFFCSLFFCPRRRISRRDGMRRAFIPQRSVCVSDLSGGPVGGGRLARVHRLCRRDLKRCDRGQQRRGDLVGGRLRILHGLRGRHVQRQHRVDERRRLRELRRWKVQ